MKHAGRWGIRRLVTALGMSLTASGCGLLLGLEEFSDAPPSAGEEGAGAGSSACTPGLPASCYDGPAETEGVGICHSGTAECNADATVGTCEDQVIPAAETCADPADEDCDGKDCLLWARMFGDATAQSIGGIAAGKDGNVYIAGSFTGTMEIVDGAPISANGTQLYLASLDATGRGRWSKGFGMGDVSGLSMDAQGGLVIAGTVYGSTDFQGEQVLCGAYRCAYVARFSMEGDLQWVQSMDTVDATTQDILRPAIDSTGAVSLLGTTYCEEYCAPASHKMWVRKYHADGTLAWHQAFDAVDAPASHELGGIRVDPFDNILVTASFNGVERFGPTTFTSEGGTNSLLLKLSAAGDYVWSSVFGDAMGEVTSTDLTTDRFGNVTLTGRFNGSVSFGAASEKTVSMGGWDVFVTKLSSGKAFLWSASFGDADFQEGSAVSAGDDDAIMLVARILGSVDFGGGSLIGSTNADTAVVKLTPEGNHLWSNLLNGHLEGPVHAAGMGGESLLGGGIESAIRVGSETLTPLGEMDAFVTRLAP